MDSDSIFYSLVDDEYSAYSLPRTANPTLQETNHDHFSDPFDP